MKAKQNLGMNLFAWTIALALLICNPLEAFAQSSRNNLLEAGSPVVLKVTEDFNTANKGENGTIAAVVDNDVYSANGSTILITKGTPATIDYSAEPNGAWGKAGKVCVSTATTKTIDNKRVSLRLNSCKNGSGRIGAVIVLSVLFFPLGLISGCIKGGMPKIGNGTTFSGSVTQDIDCTK